MAFDGLKCFISIYRYGSKAAQQTNNNKIKGRLRDSFQRRENAHELRWEIRINSPR